MAASTTGPEPHRRRPRRWRDTIARRAGRFLGVQDLFAAVETMDEHVRRLSDRLVAQEARFEAQAAVWLTMHEFQLDRPTAGPCVSVVVPTRNRAALLPRAVASVAAQTYRCWQLVIVDDASDDDTPTYLAGLDDPRIVVVPGKGQGVGAARNRGLEAATGVYVAYLDDDNVMHPDWLGSVAWAFGRHPDVRVVLGCRIIDDRGRVTGVEPDGVPSLDLPTFDRDGLRRANVGDIGVIAHWRDLPSAHFDERLDAAEDWDLLVRITADRPPLILPAIACLYTTTAPDRLSASDLLLTSAEKVRRKHGAGEP